MTCSLFLPAAPKCVFVLWHQEGGLSSGKLCSMTLSSSRVGHPVGWVSIPSISQVPWTLAPFPASPQKLIEPQAAARTHTFCGPSTCSRMMGTESEVTFLVWDSLIGLFNLTARGCKCFVQKHIVERAGVVNSALCLGTIRPAHSYSFSKYALSRFNHKT